MRDTIASLRVIALVFIGLPVCLLWARDRATTTRWRRAHSPDTRIAERYAYAQRILQPDWACVERHLQRPVPQGLRDLYADRALVTAQDLQYAMDHSISTFEALDEQAFADARSWLGFEVVAFATTDAGDAIYLRPVLRKSIPCTSPITTAATLKFWRNPPKRCCGC